LKVSGIPRANGDIPRYIYSSEDSGSDISREFYFEISIKFANNNARIHTATPDILPHFLLQVIKNISL
jgi:hypothetical protein